MSRQSPRTTLVELPTGVQVSASCRATTDWPSVRCMIEAGVPPGEVATLFKIDAIHIARQSKSEQWMTPTRVDKLRKQLARLSRETWDRTGQTKSAVELKALLWDERSERWKEKQAHIVEQALDGVTSEVAGEMIKEAKDFKAIVELARTLTGETQAEDNAPKLAVSIGFLRSGNAPRPVIIEAELA